MLITTGFYAALLALMLIWLSFRVINRRLALKVAHGTADDDQLMRCRNAHSNFTQYVPIALILMATAESANAMALLLNAVGIVLVVGRLIHAIGITADPENLGFRKTGMIMTFGAIAAAAVLNLVQVAMTLVGS